MIDPGKAFDFRAHEQAAVTAYLKRYGFYEDLASIVKRILEEALKRKGIKVYSVQARAKDPTSFGKKAPSLLSLIPRSRSILILWNKSLTWLASVSLHTSRVHSQRLIGCSRTNSGLWSA